MNVCERNRYGMGVEIVFGSGELSYDTESPVNGLCDAKKKSIGGI